MKAEYAQRGKRAIGRTIVCLAWLEIGVALTHCKPDSVAACLGWVMIPLSALLSLFTFSFACNCFALAKGQDSNWTAASILLTLGVFAVLTPLLNFRPEEWQIVPLFWYSIGALPILLLKDRFRAPINLAGQQRA